MMSSSSESFYNRLTFFYPVIDLFLRHQKRKFFAIVNAFPSGRLLEIGVGNGAHLRYFGNHDITAVDTSRGMLSRARRHAGPNVQLIHMNGEALTFPDEDFDYVVMSHVIAVVDDPERLLGEVLRVLRPGGKVFILNHFTPDNWLKYIDRSFSLFSQLFHFRSAFELANLGGMDRFKLLATTNTGMLSYFKILIYEKKL